MKPPQQALIGASGFVGTTLRAQRSFSAYYRSTDIDQIDGRSYDLVICAGAPAAKWQANQQPQADLANLQRLAGHLTRVRARRLILISTVDVLRMPPAADETAIVDAERCDAYGRHRAWLEDVVREHFAEHLIVRLPGLFGRGLRKNFIYDLLHSGDSAWTDAESRFQFYDMARLNDDLQQAELSFSGAATVHFATAPVKAAAVAREVFGIEFTNRTAAGPVDYDLQTVHAAHWGVRGPYLYDDGETLARLRAFVAAERAA